MNREHTSKAEEDERILDCEEDIVEAEVGCRLVVLAFQQVIFHEIIDANSNKDKQQKGWGHEREVESKEEENLDNV